MHGTVGDRQAIGSKEVRASIIEPQEINPTKNLNELKGILPLLSLQIKTQPCQHLDCSFVRSRAEGQLSCDQTP